MHCRSVFVCHSEVDLVAMERLVLMGFGLVVSGLGGCCYVYDDSGLMVDSCERCWEATMGETN